MNNNLATYGEFKTALEAAAYVRARNLEAMRANLTANETAVLNNLSALNAYGAAANRQISDTHATDMRATGDSMALAQWQAYLASRSIEPVKQLPPTPEPEPLLERWLPTRVPESWEFDLFWKEKLYPPPPPMTFWERVKYWWRYEF